MRASSEMHSATAVSKWQVRSTSMSGVSGGGYRGRSGHTVVSRHFRLICCFGEGDGSTRSYPKRRGRRWAARCQTHTHTNGGLADDEGELATLKTVGGRKVGVWFKLVGARAQGPGGSPPQNRRKAGPLRSPRQPLACDLRHVTVLILLLVGDSQIGNGVIARMSSNLIGIVNQEPVGSVARTYLQYQRVCL